MPREGINIQIINFSQKHRPRKQLQQRPTLNLAKKFPSKLVITILVILVAGFNFAYFKKSSSKQTETKGQVLGAFTTKTDTAQTSSDSLFAKTAQASNLQDSDTTDKKPFEYEVEGGDTVSNIAQKYNLNINTILWANKLTTKSIIKPGEKLTLLPVDGVLHKISKGETVGKIAALYKAESQAVLDYNSIDDPAKIHAGDIIIIPDGKPLPAVAPSNIAAKKNNAKIASADEQAPELSQPSDQSSGPITTLLWPTTTRNLSQRYSASHRGLDIANGGKPPILASHSGTVEFAAYSGDWGNTILIRSDDGSITTRYSHASELDVKSGEHVEAGAPIGVVGNTGHVHGVTGLHLDFRVYKNGVAINPKSMLN